jgi:hypothetical protein
MPSPLASAYRTGASAWGLVETTFGIDLCRGEREGVPKFVQACLRNARTKTSNRAHTHSHAHDV